MAALPIGAWAEDSNTTNCTWLFSQFYDNAAIMSHSSGDSSTDEVYNFEGLYFCLQGNATRTLIAKIENMPNETAPSVDDYTPFKKGSYVGMTYNAKSASWGNRQADATGNYQMASMKFGSAGKLYVLALPSYNATNRSVKIYTYENSAMTEKASATRTVNSGSPWFLLSCDVTSGQRYFIGSQEGTWTLYAVKFVPTTDKDSRKKISVNMSQGYATFSSCSNFAVPSGYKAYTAQVSEENAVLTEISDIPANTGVILKGEAVASLELSSKTSASSAVSGNDLVANVGNYTLPVSGTIVGTTYYNYTLAAGPVFKHSSGVGTLAAGKAFLRTTVNVEGGGSARSISLTFEGSDITGVNEVNVQKEDITNGEYYDLMGRRVVNPTKGLYIVNGKKVFFK